MVAVFMLSCSTRSPHQDEWQIHSTSRDHRARVEATSRIVYSFGSNKSSVTLTRPSKAPMKGIIFKIFLFFWVKVSFYTIICAFIVYVCLELPHPEPCRIIRPKKSLDPKRGNVQVLTPSRNLDMSRPGQACPGIVQEDKSLRAWWVYMCLQNVRLNLLF